jgi:hypothetical protein
MKWTAVVVIGLCLQLISSGAAAGESSVFNHKEDAQNPSAGLSSAIGHLQQINLIRGDFQQQKNLKILKQPFISRGWFIFSKTDGLYWNILEPLPNAYRINKQGIKPVDGATLESPFADEVGKLFSSVLGGDLRGLRVYFDIYYKKMDDHWQIGLKPHNRHLAAVMANIEIHGDKYIQRLKITETGGDITEIKFSNISAEPAAGTDLESHFK